MTTFGDFAHSQRPPRSHHIAHGTLGIVYALATPPSAADDRQAVKHSAPSAFSAGAWAHIIWACWHNDLS